MKLFGTGKKGAGDEPASPAPSPSPPAPTHYRIPQEQGYFPAGSDEADALLVKIDKTTLYQTHPDVDDPQPLASGVLTLRDPAAGTADDVALVGQCGETLFYIMTDDATTKIADAEFMLLLPDLSIVMDLVGCSATELLQVEGLLAARTKFHDETALEKSGKPKYPDELPDDAVSKAIFRASTKVAKLTVSAAELGASKIEEYGEKKRDGVAESECSEVKVGKTSIMLAKGTRRASEKAYSLTASVSDKISDVVGGKVGRAAAVREGDTATKKKARRLLLASSIAYAEVGGGAAEGYELMVRSAQMQATSFVSKKYGKEAAELVRHTAGAAANFGRTALTARRVVNVKKLVKSAGKQMVKEGIKNSL